MIRRSPNRRGSSARPRCRQSSCPVSMIKEWRVFQDGHEPKDGERLSEYPGSGIHDAYADSEIKICISLNIALL